MREKLLTAIAVTGGCALLYLLLHFKNSNAKKSSNSKSCRSNLKENKNDSKTFSSEKKFGEKEVNIETISNVTNRENIYETVFSQETLTSMPMNLVEKESLTKQNICFEDNDNLLAGNCDEVNSANQEKESSPACSLQIKVDLENKTFAESELILQPHANSSDTCLDDNFEVCNSHSSHNQSNINAASLTCVISQGIEEIDPILIKNDSCDFDSVLEKYAESDDNKSQNVCCDNSFHKRSNLMKDYIGRDELINDILSDLSDEIKDINFGKSDIVAECADTDINHSNDDISGTLTDKQESISEKSVNSLCTSPKSNENNSSTRSKRQRKKGKKNSVCKDTSLLKIESISPTNVDSEVYAKLESSSVEGACNISDSEVENSCLSLCSELENQVVPCTSDLEREATPKQENGTSDTNSLVSQGSCDSGQGSIEVEPDTIFGCSMLRPNKSEQYIFYQFEIPQHLVGRLIGKKGSFINKVKAATSTTIVVLDHSNTALKICSIEGQKPNVFQALDMVQHHFPRDQFSDLCLDQINSPTVSPQHQPRMNREIQQVELPPGVVAEVQASAIVSTVEVWLQQPLHPSFSALQRLHQCLNLNYGDGTSTPALPLPIQPNTVCVCKIGNHWLRCQIQSHDHEMCAATLLDIGGIVTFPICLLRQIRVDYAGLPFQAAQSFLHGIQPANDNGWSEDGRLALSELIKDRIIFATIAAYTQEGIPLVNLYQRNHNQYVYVNEKLVELGHAKWISSIPEMAATTVDSQSEMDPQNVETEFIS